MKKTFTLFTVLLTTVVTFAQTSSNAWNLQGSGTESDPYKISSAADFKSIADNISSTNTGAGEYFLVTADIDFGGTAESPVQLPAIAKAAITSITSVAWGFDGILDGGDHIISGIYHTNNANSFHSIPLSFFSFFLFVLPCGRNTRQRVFTTRSAAHAPMVSSL